MTETITLDTKYRFNAALRDARKAGVAVRQNVMSCCRGCVPGSKLGLPDDALDTAPYAFTFGGQGHATKWVGDVLVNRSDYNRADRNFYVEDALAVSAVKTVWFNHANGAGPILAAAFRAHGFDVDYDGSDSRTVCVKVGA